MTGDGVGSGNVALDWDDNEESNLAGYNVYRHTESFSDIADATLVNSDGPLSFSDFFDSGLSDGTTYHYRAVAVDEDSNTSDASDEVSATPSPDTTPPAAPTNLAATAGDSEVKLTWHHNTEMDLAGYDLYRSTSSSVTVDPGNKVNTDPIADSSYTDTGLSNGTTYYYVLTASDQSGNESSASSEVNATPQDVPPAAPTGLTATAGDGQVTLDWDANSESDMASYEVHRSESSGFTPDDGTTRIATPSHAGSGESYTDTGVSNGTQYYYKVVAVDASGNESDPSDEASATPAADTTAPDVPTRLVLADQQFEGSPSGDNEVHLGWVSSVAGDLAGYNLYRSTSSPVSTSDTQVNSSLIPVKQTTYIDDGVANDNTYYYRVTAVDVNGNESSLSNEVVAGPTSLSDDPSGAPATPMSVGLRVGDGEVAVVLSTANDESDLRGYNLYRGTGASCTATTGDTKVNGSTPISRGTLTYVDDGVSNGQDYCYGITAVDFAGNESAIQTSDEYSNVLRATPDADKGGVSVDFIEWLPEQSSWTSSQIGSGTFDPDTKLHYVYNGWDETNRPFDVVAYGGDEVGISGMYDLNFNDPGAKNMQGGPGDAPALSPLAGLTNGTGTEGSTTSLDTQFNPELTLKFKVYDEKDPLNELAYMIVTGSVKGVSYQDNDSAPDLLTLTVSPADFANTPQGGDMFPGEGGLYISFFSKAFQGSSEVPNAVFANNVYASDITASADLSQLSDMAGIEVSGTDGNPVSLKFFFNKASIDAAWGIASASDIEGYRETGTDTDAFESITASASVDGSNFDLNFDGSTDDTYVVDLSNDAWSKRFVTAGASGGAVPVELTSFDGVMDDAGVTLRWETASETNNAGFEVERRAEGGLFEQVGYVEGQGTTTEPQAYRFTDTDLPAESGTFTYRLKQVDLDGSFEYSSEVEFEVGIPDRFALEAPYPNPFANMASIRYALPRASDVHLSVYNVLGQRVVTLVDGEQSAGRRTVTFDPRGLSSGVYFIRMRAGDFTATQRVTFAR